MMIRCLCLGACVGFLFAACSFGEEPGEGDAAGKELAKLQGKWREVEASSDGRVEKTDHGLVTEFQKDIKIEYDAKGGVVSKGTIKLDPSKSPKEIDETITKFDFYPSLVGTTQRGIYQLDGDELKISFPSAPNRQRPKDFTTKVDAGGDFSVSTYRRVKP